MAMTSEPTEVASDDRLWAALANAVTPVAPIIILLLEDKRDRPFIKAHNVQALIYGLALNVVGVVTSGVLLGLCLWPLGVALQLYWAYQAYQGKLVTIPIITDFVKNRGWA
jgi:uncharacterized membrane protein